MRVTISAVFACLVLTGCMKFIISEPYPAIIPKEIPTTDLPEEVVTVLRLEAPDFRITRAVGWEFKGRITTYDVTVISGQVERVFQVSSDGTCCKIKEPKSTQP